MFQGKILSDSVLSLSLQRNEAIREKNNINLSDKQYLGEYLTALYG